MKFRDAESFIRFTSSQLNLIVLPLIVVVAKISRLFVESKFSNF